MPFLEISRIPDLYPPRPLDSTQVGLTHAASKFASTRRSRTTHFRLASSPSTYNAPKVGPTPVQIMPQIIQLIELGHRHDQGGPSQLMRQPAFGRHFPGGALFRHPTRGQPRPELLCGYVTPDSPTPSQTQTAVQDMVPRLTGVKESEPLSS